MVCRYQAGDIAGAYVARGGAGRGPRVVDQGIKDAATFVEGEAAAMVEWDFVVEQAATIDSPVLSCGAASENPINPAVRAFLYELFPQRDEVIHEGGDHFSVTTDPAAVAEPIAEFLSRHSPAAALS